MQSTNRKWQNHLNSKGIIPFFLDRLKSHALRSDWQHKSNSFFLPMQNDESDDALSKAFFKMIEEFPYEFYMEITNKCNLDCKMCARSVMKRPQGIMKNSLFKKIIDEIISNQPYAYIHYYGIGESLLDPDLLEKLEYAQKKGVKNSVIFTNGQLLLENDLFKKLIHSGIATIGIDIDGFTPEIYNSIRRGGDFFVTKKAIETIYHYARKSSLNTRIELAYQVYPGINDNEKDIEKFIKWCNANQYEYKLVNMHTWSGLRQDVPKTNLKGLPDDHFSQRQNPCCMLWSGFFIAWDGRIAICFQDADLNECMGDVNKESITSIWNNSLKKKRFNHVNGIIEGLCKKCVSGTNVKLPPFKSSIYPEELLLKV